MSALGQAASGGELSRVMLALHVVTEENPVLLVGLEPRVHPRRTVVVVENRAILSGVPKRTLRIPAEELVPRTGHSSASRVPVVVVPVDVAAVVVDEQPVDQIRYVEILLNLFVSLSRVDTGVRDCHHRVPRFEIAVDRFAAGDHAGAIAHLDRSIAQGMTSARIADRILTDHAAFPTRPLPGKAGGHGGDLTWPWYLGALLRTVEPLARLHDELTQRGLHTRELQQRIKSGARFAASALGDYGEPIHSERFERWRSLVATESARLSVA